MGDGCADPREAFDDVVDVIGHPSGSIWFPLICYVYVSRSHAWKSDTAESKMKTYGAMTRARTQTR